MTDKHTFQGMGPYSEIPEQTQPAWRPGGGNESEESFDADDAFDPDVRPDLQMHQRQLEMERTTGEPPEDVRPLARKGLKTYKTGPKGVLADYNEARLRMRARRLREKIQREAKLSKGFFSNRLVAPSPAAPLKHQGVVDSDEEDLSDDDEIVREYKRERIRVAHEELPSFGTVSELIAKNFDKEVDGEPDCVTIVVHIYQDYIERCARMATSLERIAMAYPHVKFMKGRSDRLLPDYPDDACPTLIVFKAKKQIKNLVCVMDFIATPFSDQALVDYLIHEGVLTVAKTSEDLAIEEMKRRADLIRGISAVSISKDDSDDSDLDL